MFRKKVLTMFVLATLAASASCTPEQATPTPTPAANIANPASVYCEQHGGKLEMRLDSQGGTAGFCKFSDGSECDEWAYFRGQCKPGGTGQ